MLLFFITLQIILQMPPFGGIFQLIAASGRQDTMLMGDFRFNNRRHNMQLYSQFEHMYKCECCNELTENNKIHNLDSILCRDCKNILMRLVRRAKGQLKNIYPGIKINQVGKWQYNTLVAISASCADESATLANLLVDKMGFKHFGDLRHTQHKMIQLVTVGAPETIRELGGGTSYVTYIQFDIKPIMNIDSDGSTSHNNLVKLATSVVGKHIAGFEILPSELLDPIIIAQPILGVRFLFA
ncbi:hypothetical protein D5a_00279 [Faustovirus]|nr:hypothetical protein D5a_00279 [Faustovirus]QBR99173.1 hypothetical protein [Faustovirus mariensis]